MLTIDNLANIYYAANKHELDKFLLSQEAADKIGIKLSWLQDKRCIYNKILRPFRLGRCNYYNINNIDDAINNIVKYVTQKQLKKKHPPVILKLVKPIIKKKVVKKKIKNITTEIDINNYYNTTEVAQVTGWALRTLYNRRNLRMSPAYIKYYGKAYYPKKDIDALAKSKGKR